MDEEIAIELADVLIDIEGHLLAGGVRILQGRLQPDIIRKWVELVNDMPDELREPRRAPLIMARGFLAFFAVMAEAEAALNAMDEERERGTGGRG